MCEHFRTMVYTVLSLIIIIIIIPACHFPLCRWRYWNCFSKEEIQIFCPSFYLFQPIAFENLGPRMGRVSTSRARSVVAWVPHPKIHARPPSCSSLDTALQLGAHSGVILSWRRSGPLATVDILFLASCFVFSLRALYSWGHKHDNNNNHNNIFHRVSFFSQSRSRLWARWLIPQLHLILSFLYEVGR